MPTIKLKLGLNKDTPKTEETINTEKNIISEIKSEIPSGKKLSIKNKETETPVEAVIAETPVLSKKSIKPLISLSKKEDFDENKIIVNEKENSVIDANLISRSKNPEGEIFTNYYSDFRKNEKTILQQIKAMRFVPKTRSSLVFGLIGITILTISILGIIDPKNHSLNNYKTNILYAIGKKPVQIPSQNTNKITSNINNTNTPNNGNTITSTLSIIETTNSGSIISNTGTTVTATGSSVTETGSTTETTSSGVILPIENTEIDNGEIIKEKWLSVNAEVVTLPNGDKVYSYKGNTYSKDGLKEVLKKEVEETVDKKIKDHLTEIYIKN